MLVAHPVGSLEERFFKALDEDRIELHLNHRLLHALHPLVTLGDADGERQMPCTQERVAEAILAFFAPLDYSHSPQYLALLDEGLELAREQMSVAEFATAQTEGRAMTLDQAIAEAGVWQSGEV